MELAKATSDLRIDERTRLAVDIHDSLSQTLTGVSFQIDAAEKTDGADPRPHVLRLVRRNPLRP